MHVDTEKNKAPCLGDKALGRAVNLGVWWGGTHALVQQRT